MDFVTEMLIFENSLEQRLHFAEECSIASIVFGLFDDKTMPNTAIEVNCLPPNNSES